MNDNYKKAQKVPLPATAIGDVDYSGVGNAEAYSEVVADHPTYAASAGLPNDHITSRTLNPNSTAGAVAMPSFGGGMSDSIISTMSADVTNSEAMGEANPMPASSENMSAHYKYPSKSQDAGPGGSQYQTPQ